MSAIILSLYFPAQLSERGGGDTLGGEGDTLVVEGGDTLNFSTR